jgi:hypothetical protein
MHKTGTTSLHKAFHQLHFKSWHWQSAHEAKAIWAEMVAFNKSTTLEHYYALCDLPIPLLFKSLDKAYPNSRFILTTREEESWLTSVERHWSRDHNPWRHAWDTDPFTHCVHKLLYGQKGFDREVFRARYRRHNEEVQAYFAQRPQDLLILPLESSDKWPSLCHFLNVPMPATPYPHANGT